MNRNDEPDYTDRQTILGPRRGVDLQSARKVNNPRNEPVGHYTGRCNRCGSTDLWDDNLNFGCNGCGAFLT